MSGFYKVLRSDAPPGAVGGDYDVKAFYQDETAYWLHSALFPHPLEGVIPAEVIGATWQAVWDAAPAEVRAVFMATVRRDGDRLRCLYGDMLEADELLSVFAPHRFEGEPPAKVVP